MKKYKLLKDAYSSPYKAGEIYDENYQRTEHHMSVGRLVEIYPQDWELVEEEFVLPEKWCVAVTEESRETLGKWRVAGAVGVLAKDKYEPSGYCYSPDGRWSEYKSRDYTEITFEQFKQYVLGMKEEQKEIVGWKLKDEFKQCREAALKLSNTIGNWENCLMEYDISVSQTKYMNKLKQAGVLDLWFEPVFANKTPQIIVNGYKAEFFDEYVKFGCAEINKQCFIDIDFQIRLHCKNSGHYQNRDIESVTIGKGTFTKEQIKQIAEYYLNKDK